MQHCPARAAQRLAAAVLALVLLLCAFLPHAHAAELKEKNGIRLLSFDTSHILSIGNQTSGKCSLYALRYARTILDGKVCSGSGMWSNGAVWSAAGYTGYSGTRAECLKKLYSELSAGHPVIVHLKNTTVSGVKRHTNRTSTYEYHLTSSGWSEVLGAGVVNNKVLEGCGIDTNEYSGFAFGIGIERIAMLKYGINNIKLLFESDLRVLKQIDD